MFREVLVPKEVKQWKVYCIPQLNWIITSPNMLSLGLKLPQSALLDAHRSVRHGPDLAPGRGGAMGRDMGQIRTINDAGIDNAVLWWGVQGAQSKWSNIDTPALPPSPTGQHQGLRLSLRRMVPRTPGDASLGASVHVSCVKWAFWTLGQRTNIFPNYLNATNQELAHSIQLKQKTLIFHNASTVLLFLLLIPVYIL